MHGGATGLLLGDETFLSTDNDILAQISKLVKPEGTIVLSACGTGKDSICPTASGFSSMARIISRSAPTAYVIAAVDASGGARLGYDPLSAGMKYSVHFELTNQLTFKGGRIIIPEYLENSCPISIRSNAHQPELIHREITGEASKSISSKRQTEFFDISGRRTTVTQTRVNFTGNNRFRVMIKRNKSEGKEFVEKCIVIQ
jgi:hypothetical protein